MDHDIVSIKFGLLRPLDWRPECEQEMAKMTALWNRLVVIEGEARGRYRAVMQAQDKVRVQQDRIDAAMAERAALTATRAEQRKAARKRVKTPELDARIAALGQQLHELIETRRVLDKEVRAEIKPHLDRIEEWRKAEVKRARQQSELYWPNYNAVVQGYERARMLAMKRGGTLRAKTQNSKRLTVQIQGGVTVADFFAGECNAARISGTEPLPREWSRSKEERHGSRYPWKYSPETPKLGITVRTVHSAGMIERVTATWPIILNEREWVRDSGWRSAFPPDARIQELAVVREMIMGRWKWSVVFTCRVPKQEHALREGVCGIDIGWRKTDHGLRVAVIHGDAKPYQIAGSYELEEIILPPAILERIERRQEVIHARAQDRHELLLRLNSVNWERAPERLREKGLSVLDKRDDKGQQSATYFDLRGLVMHWRLEDFLPDLRAELEDWYRDDRKAMEYLRATQRAMLARREFYRITAKRIVDTYGTIGLEKIDLADMSSKAVDVLPREARRLRYIAAISELLDAIKNAAKREGSLIHFHAGKSSFVCHGCGHTTAVNDRGAQFFTCGHCGRTHDQDVNAARVLCAVAREHGSVAIEETKLPAAWQKRLEGKKIKREAA